MLVTTLTKRMSEDLTDYLQQHNVRVRYLHSDIDAIERVEILRGLRLGEFDVLVGINLLREGLDLPEVSLVAILDADHEGFLRSDRSLIQTCGRAARHLSGKAILYADRMTGSMQRAIDEMSRRREIQRAHNIEHNITPMSIVKSLDEVRLSTHVADARTERPDPKKKDRSLVPPDLHDPAQRAAADGRTRAADEGGRGESRIRVLAGNAARPTSNDLQGRQRTQRLAPRRSRGPALVDQAALEAEGERLGRELVSQSVVWLDGPLGAGKTTRWSGRLCVLAAARRARRRPRITSCTIIRVRAERCTTSIVIASTARKTPPTSIGRRCRRPTCC